MKKTGLTPFPEALRLVLGNVHTVNPVEMPLLSASGFILRSGIRADRDLPPFNRSAMDGYAVRFSELVDGVALFRPVGILEAGDAWKGKIGEGECLKIMTGAPVPRGLDIVVPVEHSKPFQNMVELREPGAVEYLNVHRMGVDARKGNVVVEKGSGLNPRNIAVAASVGAATVCVSRPIRIAVISTGRELTPVSAFPSPSQIRDSNAPFLMARLKAIPWVKTSFCGIVKDDPRRLKTVLEDALRNSDMVLLSGGVSMGDADHTPAVLKALKVKNIFHKSAIRPGKPLWFGMRKKTAVFGLPGNPVSVGATFHEFAFPALRKMAGMADPGVRAVFLPLASPAKKKHPLREFRVARLEKGGAAVAPVESYRGSGDFVSAALSDGVIVIPEDRREMPAGEIVEFHPWDMV